MPKTVLVTGAAGFIGSHVCETLLRAGAVVVGVDNYNDYYDPERKRANVREVGAAVGPEAAQRFHMHAADVRDDASTSGLFERFRPDAVVHLAAMAGVRASAEQPELYYDVNLTGTLKMLEAARKHGRPNFVFASTSSAYGRTERIPFTEDDAADRPLAPYPASKRAAELLGHAYHHLHGIDFTALRFFTVYGPRGRPDMLPMKILNHLYRGDALSIYNGGKLKRDWTYVTDVADAVVRAAGRRLGYEIINVGRGGPVDVTSFIETVEACVDKRVVGSDAPMPDTDMEATFAGITKAQRLLEYQPRVSVEEGAARMVDWYRREILG